jgi:hypothetical protein
VLTGSHVTGTAHAHSDIDLVVLLARAPKGDWVKSAQRRGFLVNSAWETARSVRVALRNPRLLTTFVPGWRECVILADPSGVAARLQAEARRWTWDRVADVCDAWVAEEIVGWAEEVHKLAGALEHGSAQNAAAQRSLLALQLAGVMAVRRRILYGTENVMWDRVSEAMGEPWASAQATALSMRGEPLEASCRAALRLYALAADEAWELLDRRQRAVVGNACAIAGWPRTN